MSTDPDQTHEGVHFDNRSSNPNSGGDQGLTGDMGISSERTGPEGEQPRDALVDVGGTGTRGGALESTDGELDVSPGEWDAVDVSQPDVHPNRPTELDDRDGAPQSGWTSEQNVDRTVGETRPNPIPDEKSRRSDDS